MNFSLARGGVVPNLLVLLFTLTVALTGSAQTGYVNFRNYSPANYIYDGMTGLKAAGTDYKATLYASTVADPNSLTPVATTTFLTAAQAGLYNGGTISVLGLPVGVTVYLQIRVWSRATIYPTWETAQASGDPYVVSGSSTMFAKVLGSAISAPTLTELGGFYLYPAVAPTGALTVTLGPAGAITAGAQWQVDGGGWQSSGATVSGLSAGTHTVNFSTISGWTTPASQNVTISGFQTTTATGTYVQVAQNGNLQVNLSPAAAVSAGARWRMDGGSWQTSGTTLTGVSVGSHTVGFSAVTGWTAPANQTVTISAGASTVTAGTYQPFNVSVRTVASLTTGRRYLHTATLLSDGKVLVAGGNTNSSSSGYPMAECFDPATGNWFPTGFMNVGREVHSATLLTNGTVLVAGGYGNSFLNSAEIYDPVSGRWSPTGNLFVSCDLHTATLLPNGKVLVAHYGSSELYNPATGQWEPGGNLNSSRYYHTATLLPNGKVLVAGGMDNYTALASAEIYDPATGGWTATGSMAGPRYDHTATLLPNGKVLVAGGTDFSSALATAELYDPVIGVWTSTGGLSDAREKHSATLLPNGQVLVAGGGYGYALTSTELYDPATGQWTPSKPLNIARQVHTATLLPDGQVLFVGGYGTNSTPILASAELYTPCNGKWQATGSMATVRTSGTSTLLPDGKVLSVGGQNGSSGRLASTELYNPSAGSWTSGAFLNVARCYHTVTWLGDGKLLVAGGFGGSGAEVASAEVFSPTGGTFAATGPMKTARAGHTATWLPNNQVLVAGGHFGTGWGGTGWTGMVQTASAEIYLPATGTWIACSPMASVRSEHTATLLANGKVLVAGGYWSNYLSGCELFDPTTGNWTATGALNAPRGGHTATLLPNGKVLVAGGYHNNYLATAELYDPATGLWSLVSSMTVAHSEHTATLLPSGMVLIVGGRNTNGVSAVAEMFDPASQTWITNGVLAVARYGHAADLTLDGKVIVTGGQNSGGSLSSAELFDPALGFTNTWQPQLSSYPASITLGNPLTLGGSKFRGNSGASSGSTREATTDFPVVQVRHLASGRIRMLRPTGWSPNSFNSEPLTNFPSGPALVTVFVNGIPSTSFNLNIVRLPAAVVLSDLTHVFDGTAKSVSATTTPPGLPILATYDGSLLVPTNIGNYTVLGIINDPNYQGATTNVLSIVIPDNSTNVIAAQSATLGTGETATASTAPKSTGLAGVTASATNAGLGTLLVVVANYAAPPTNAPAFEMGTTYTDIRVWGADASDSLLASFYYPATISGSSEAALTLAYWNGSSWSAVRGPGVTPPAKDITDNLDATVSGGRFRVLLGYDSIPMLSSLTGTFFAVASVVPPPPPQLSVSADESGAAFEFAFASTPGGLFSVYSTTNIAVPPGLWNFVGTPTESPAGQFHFIDPQSTNFTQRFFQIRSP